MNTLIVGSGTGVTSCLSVRLHDTIRYREKYGDWPDNIDSSNQFSIYRDQPGQDVSEFILAPYNKPEKKMAYPDYYEGWQYNWYDEIYVESLSPLANIICMLHPKILNKASDFLKRIEGRTAILYRGNDKKMEIGITPYEDIFKIAKEIGSKYFVVQTDEKEFYDEFCKEFPDTICFDEIPTMNRNYEKYVMPETGNKVNFSINFLAALVAISQAKNLIITTGNTGIWTILFRGNIEGVYQYHGNHKKGRKLGQN